MTDAPAPTRRELLAAAALATVAFAVLAWPWVRQALVAIPDPAAANNAAWGADARLILWILAWDVHALVHEPLRLFDAPIFHPGPRMLAGSEHLLGHLPLTGPIALLTGNHVLAANAAGFASYLGAGVVGYACFRLVGLGAGASAAAAVALTLGPLRVPVDLHVLQYPGWALPLVVAAAARDRPVQAAVAVALAIFTSYYVAAMVAAVLAVEVPLAAAARGPRAATRLATAGATAFVALAAISLPYVPLVASPRPDVAGVQRFVGDWMLARLANPLDPEFGMGLPVALLVPLGLLAPAFLRRRPPARWWRWVAFVAIGVVVARGTFADTPLGALRAISRFILLAHFGLVGLAAEGVALVLAVLPGRARGAAAVAVVAAILASRAGDLASAPFTRTLTPERIRPVDRFLAAAPRGPLLQLPPGGAAPTLLLRQSEAMVQQIVHGQPLVDGHTGFTPWWASAVREEAWRLPEPRAAQALVDLTGLRWVLVPASAYPPTDLARWGAGRSAALEPVPDVGPDRLFRVPLAPRRPWAAAIARGAPEPGKTILGTPLAPLAPSAAIGRVTFARPPGWANAGGLLPLEVEVQHLGDADWPALAPAHAPARLLVGLRASWHPLAAEPEAPEEIVRLPRDVIAGERMACTVRVRTPETPGHYTLTLSLVQTDGTPFSPGGEARLPLQIRGAGVGP
jgi:hypothetical protein